MSRLVHRDPFAREELHAERIHNPDTTCRECGSHRQTPSGVLWLYRFWIEYDSLGARKAVDEYLFCSRQCRTCYYS